MQVDRIGYSRYYYYMADNHLYSNITQLNSVATWLATILIHVPELVPWISAAMSVMEEHFTLIVALEGLAETTNEAYGRGDMDLLARVGDCLEEILKEPLDALSADEQAIPITSQEAVNLSFFPNLDPEVLLALSGWLGERATTALERLAG